MEKDKVKHINRKVAVTVAVISTFLAVSKVKDDNIVQAMQQSKFEAIDTWNEYQAKKLKDHIAKNSILQNEGLATLLGPKKGAHLLQVNENLNQDLKRYAEEEKQLSEKAKKAESNYDALNYVDDQFDLSDACLSVALMVCAMAALTGQGGLLWFSWGLSALGLSFGLGAFLKLPIHPDWIVKLLS